MIINRLPHPYSLEPLLDYNAHPNYGKNMRNLLLNPWKWTTTLLLWLPVALLPAIAAAADFRIDEKDQPFVNHLARYVITGWSSEKIPGAMSSAREKFKAHWFVLTDHRSKIGILGIEQDNEHKRRIVYYYKTRTQAASAEAYEATIVKTGGNTSEYLIVDLQPHAYDMQPYLRKHFAKGVKSFDRLFTPIKIDALDYKNNAGKLPDIQRQPITNGALEVLTSGTSNDPYYALYKIKYERGITGYIIGTPTCYGTANSGLTLYMVDRKKLKNKAEGVIYQSQIPIRENTCGDAGEEWYREGHFVDLNNDGYLDIITKQVSGGHDLESNKPIPTQEMATHYIYKKRGGFEAQSITSDRYEEILSRF